MKSTKVLTLVAGAFLIGGLAAGQAGAAVINLYDWAVNIDGVVSVAPDSGFGPTGTYNVSVSGAGSHYVGGFFDVEIDEADNTFYNESGSVSGTPASGQTWEIDEPGYVFGNIYTNFSAGTLDGTNGVPAGSEDDVSMAMGWDFTLLADETAFISFILSGTEPNGGFYLTHTDPDSNESVYFSSTLNIRPDGPPVIPEPGTMILLGSGLMGLAGWRRRGPNA